MVESDAPRKAKTRHALVLDDGGPKEHRAVLQENRLALLALLAGPAAFAAGGYSIRQLGEILGCSLQNAHHHVKALESAGLARVARTERTQRIPTQFWLSDLRRIDLKVRGVAGLRILLGEDAETAPT